MRSLYRARSRGAARRQTSRFGEVRAARPPGLSGKKFRYSGFSPDGKNLLTQNFEIRSRVLIGTGLLSGAFYFISLWVKSFFVFNGVEKRKKRTNYRNNKIKSTKNKNVIVNSLKSQSALRTLNLIHEIGRFPVILVIKSLITRIVHERQIAA